ncbi:MAG: long-chain fatty acid--CoA ligase [Leptospiraceae bacterium]|nr:long-chain fatty acid--CoA ligase [Leptospiraceae bacterium]
MSKKQIPLSECRHLADVYRLAADVHGDRPAFATRVDRAEGKFQAISFAELYESGCRLATALIELGVGLNQHVGILSDNRYEWILADYAVQLCGAVDVPRGSDVTDFDITYILSHAGVRVLFVEDEAVLRRVQNCRAELPDLEVIIMLHPAVRAEGDVLHVYDLLEKGRVLREQGDRRVESRFDQIKGDDLFTLIYTSGTTGTPRGVMLTHNNILSQLRALPIRITNQDRILSILPIWHIFERTFEISSIFFGACTYYSDVRNLRTDLQKVRPTFMASAPRLWEMLYDGITQKVLSGGGVGRVLFQAAVFCAARVKRGWRFLTLQQASVQCRNPIVSLMRAMASMINMVLFFAPYVLLNALVLRKIRRAVGGAMRFSCSGGGALPAHVDDFFNNIGIPVLEGYGLTETSPIVAARKPGRMIIGTVGDIIADTQIQLREIESGAAFYESALNRRPSGSHGRRGVVWVRGPQVMKGYYRNQEATQRVIDAQGWFNSGDLGLVTCNGCLKIIGRAKETIVLLSGENVEPVPIENALQRSACIAQVMVVGQDRKSLGALVVPALNDQTGYASYDYERMLSDRELHARLRSEIKQFISAQQGFKAFERVTTFAIVPRPFEKGDELTAKLSLKRHVIQDKYADLIEQMYAGSGRPEQIAYK